MALITLDIGNNVDRIKTGMLAVFPNKETIPDPNWVDPGDGSSAPQIAKYTDSEWLKEVIRRWIAQQVRRGESKIAKDAAQSALTNDTDSLIS